MARIGNHDEEKEVVLSMVAGDEIRFRGNDAAEEMAATEEKAVLQQNRREVGEWARSALEDENTLILALATTGLRDPVDVVEVVVLGSAGETFFASRVRPMEFVAFEKLDGKIVEVRRDPVEVERDAANIHGHTAASLADAPTFSEIHPRFRQALSGERVIVYNAEYVGRVLEQTLERYALEPIVAKIECAMVAQARVAGDWDFGSETYRHAPLMGRDGTPHGNARALLDLVRELAADDDPEPSGVSGRRRQEAVDTSEDDFIDVPF